MPHKQDMLAERVLTNAEPDLTATIARLAETSLARHLLFFDQQRSWINEQHLEICRVPAATFREQQRADYLVSLFREMGHQARLDDAGNVVCPIVFDEQLPFVAVSAHMDTVIAPRQISDVYLRPDGTMEGPGVTDNGSGLAALVALARVFEDGLPVPDPVLNLLLVANVAEEGEGNLHGMKYLCRHSPFAPRIAAYLVLDGASTGHITAEALGSRRFEIIIEGHGGHSWNDFGTANPVHALGRTVAVLADTDLPTTPRTTLSVGVIEGGSGVNSIAPVARAKIDIRSQSSSVMKQLVKTTEDAVRLGVEMENRRSTQRLSNYKIREIGNRPAAPLSPDNYLVDYVRSVDAHLHIRSRLDCASTDANEPLAAGLPAVAIGAGGRGGNAHTTAEWFNPEGRELGLRRILLVLSLLLTEQP